MPAVPLQPAVQGSPQPPVPGLAPGALPAVQPQGAAPRPRPPGLAPGAFPPAAQPQAATTPTTTDLMNSIRQLSHDLQNEVRELGEGRGPVFDRLTQTTGNLNDGVFRLFDHVAVLTGRIEVLEVQMVLITQRLDAMGANTDSQTDNRAAQPPAEQPPAEQPPAEQPTAEQPTAEQPPVEQPHDNTQDQYRTDRTWRAGQWSASSSSEWRAARW